jgi:hypothetical protein
MCLFRFDDDQQNVYVHTVVFALLQNECIYIETGHSESHGSNMDIFFCDGMCWYVFCLFSICLCICY